MAQRRGKNKKYPPVLIFSAQRKELSAREDARRHRECRLYLIKHDIPYKEVEGCYEGIKEQSFVVPSIYAADVFDLSQKYGQETVLYLDEERRAVVLDATGEVLERLPGYWRGFDKRNLEAFDCWTFDPATGEYYSVY